MADHGVLFEVLRRFARTLTNRYELDEVLLELCEHVTEVLDASGAGVSLFDENGDLCFVSATSETVVAAEKAQEKYQAGPCISSVVQRRPIAVRDVREHADRWPGFASTVEAHGMTAVLGLPLVLDNERIGSLNVYDDRVREWSEEQVTAATVLADVAGAYIFNASELQRSRRLAEQLQNALDSRVVIEQAKGIVSAERGVPVGDAFQAMRRHARVNGVTLRSVAEAIVERGADVLSAT